ncbi:hypothetical protein AB0N93_21075 [Streptomyces sp. NPDC091267]|uniref:hypothetical protein n=1 Tax=Streptomyces sp. NPDC091267 TaxID=3155195 RepID=UPI003440D268
MTSTTTPTTSTPRDVAELVKLQSEFGDWALLGWRPRGGFADPHSVDLRRVQAGLQRLLS